MMKASFRRSTVRMTIAAAFLAAGSFTLRAEETAAEPAEQNGYENGSTCAPTGCASCARPGFFKVLKQHWHEFDWEQVHPDHCWPEQYSREAARRVNAPLGAQMLAGIRLESTIWEHYFDPKTPEVLNEAGRSRIRYLARRRPYIMPQLELQATFNQDVDQKRIAAVTEYASSVSLEPVAWNVVLVNRGTPQGLFGLEGPKAIDKMIGIAGQPPRYEPQIKQNFFSASTAEE